MEDIIREIIKIEYEAKGIIETAIQEKRDLETKHKNEMIELEERIMKDARRKVKQIRDREMKEAIDKEEAKRRICDHKIRQIEEHSRLNLELWVDEIFRRVTSN